MRSIVCSLSTHFKPKLDARTLSHLTIAVVLGLLVTASLAAQVAPPFGPYGLVLNATNAVPSTEGGAALLGLMNFDGAGNITGSFTFEVGSGGSQGAGHPGSAPGTLSGTYSTNPDGTGTITGTLDFGSGFPTVDVTLAMVLSNRSRSIGLVLTQCTGFICSGDVVSGVAEVVFDGLPHLFHQRSLRGSYGLQTTKTEPTNQESVNVWTFDGAGNVTLTGTYISGAMTVASETLSGTYTVNPDGTGMITVPPPTGQGAGKTWLFVITDSRSGLLVLQTNRAGDGVVYGIGRLQ